jgi:hypothetical protein
MTGLGCACLVRAMRTTRPGIRTARGRPHSLQLPRNLHGSIAAISVAVRTNNVKLFKSRLGLRVNRRRFAE